MLRAQEPKDSMKYSKPRAPCSQVNSPLEDHSLPCCQSGAQLLYRLGHRGVNKNPGRRQEFFLPGREGPRCLLSYLSGRGAPAARSMAAHTARKLAPQTLRMSCAP